MLLVSFVVSECYYVLFLITFTFVFNLWRNGVGRSKRTVILAINPRMTKLFI